MSPRVGPKEPNDRDGERERSDCWDFLHKRWEVRAEAAAAVRQHSQKAPTNAKRHKVTKTTRAIKSFKEEPKQLKLPELTNWRPSM